MKQNGTKSKGSNLSRRSEGRRGGSRQVERLGIGGIGVLLGVLLGVLALGVSVVALLVGLGKQLLENVLDGIEATLVLSGGVTKALDVPSEMLDPCEVRARALDVLSETLDLLEATVRRGLRFQGLLSDELGQPEVRIEATAAPRRGKVFRQRSLLVGAHVAIVQAREGGGGEVREGVMTVLVPAATTTGAAAPTGSSEGAAVAAAAAPTTISSRRVGSPCFLKPGIQIKATTDVSRTTRITTASTTSDEGRGVGVGGTTGPLVGLPPPLPLLVLLPPPCTAEPLLLVVVEERLRLRGWGVEDFLESLDLLGLLERGMVAVVVVVGIGSSSCLLLLLLLDRLRLCGGRCPTEGSPVGFWEARGPRRVTRGKARGNMGQNGRPNTRPILHRFHYNYHQ